MLGAFNFTQLMSCMFASKYPKESRLLMPVSLSSYVSSLVAHLESSSRFCPPARVLPTWFEHALDRLPG